MRNISFKQIIILIFIYIFFFGDFYSLKKKLEVFIKSAGNFIFKNTRKKGT